MTNTNALTYFIYKKFIFPRRIYTTKKLKCITLTKYKYFRYSKCKMPAVIFHKPLNKNAFHETTVRSIKEEKLTCIKPPKRNNILSENMLEYYSVI